MSLPPRISPSRFASWFRCKREWYLSQVLRIHTWDEEPTYFWLGSKAHAVAEDLLLGREPRHGGWEYEIGACFAELTHAAVAKIGGIEYDIEVDGVYLGVPGGGYLGRVDAWGIRADGALVLIDHKTSSDPKRAADAWDARSNWQALLYGAALLAEHPDHVSILCHWHWLPSKRRAYAMDGAEVREHRLTRDQCMDAARIACQASVEMLELAARDEIPLPYFVTEHDPMESRCIEGYACEYVGHCNRNEEIDMSALMDKIRAAKGNAPKAEAPAPKPVAINPDPAQAPAPVGETVVRSALPDFIAAIKDAQAALGPAGLESDPGAVLGWILGRLA